MTNSSAGSENTQIQPIDGLRAVAVMMVILAHLGAGNVLPGGLGVTLFFFISGYLITMLMIEEYDANGALDVRNFYIRRFLRLAPPLLTMVLIVSSVFALIGEPIRGGKIAAASLYYANYFGIIYPAPTEPLDPMWSLAVEEHYYLIFPLAFCLGWKNPKNFLLLICVAILASLAWRCWLVFETGASELRTYTSTDTRVDSILFGAVLAVVLKINNKMAAKWAERMLPLALATLLATLSIRVAAFRETLRYTMQGLALIPLFFCAVYSSRYRLISRLLSSRPMKKIGKLSYSLYLWHFPVLLLIQHTRLAGISFIVANVAIDIILAEVSFRFIERPFFRLRHYFRARDIGGAITAKQIA